MWRPLSWLSRPSPKSTTSGLTNILPWCEGLAGWHTSSRLALPEGLHLLFLPAHSPELQPAERLWPLSNEPLANRVFNSLDELEQVQADRCRWLQAHPEIIRGRTAFHWWPSFLNTT